MAQQARKATGGSERRDRQDGHRGQSFGKQSNRRQNERRYDSRNRPHVPRPTHHDEVAAGRLDTPIEPLVLRLRDELPNVHPISPLYREPVCFDTQTKAVYVGESARDVRTGGTK